MPPQVSQQPTSICELVNPLLLIPRKKIGIDSFVNQVLQRHPGTVITENELGKCFAIFITPNIHSTSFNADSANVIPSLSALFRTTSTSSFAAAGSAYFSAEFSRISRNSFLNSLLVI